MQLPKKIFIIFLVALLSAAFLVGCTGNNKSGQNAADITYTENTAIEVSIALPGIIAAEEGTVSAEVYQTILEKFGIKITPIDLQGMDYSAYIRQAALSGTLPDLFSYDLFNKIEISNWQEQGLLHTIDANSLSNYTDLSNVIRPDTPFYIPVASYTNQLNAGQTLAIYYRKDWAHTLGYSMDEQPLTWQVFLNLMYDYAKKDPDGDSKRNTYGITAAGSQDLINLFLMTFGVRDWVLEDDTWTAGLMSNRAQTAISWMNKMYRDGIIDNSFDTLSEQDMIKKLAVGQTGMMIADADADTAEHIQALWNIYNPDYPITDCVDLLYQPFTPMGVSYNEQATPAKGIFISSSVDDEKWNRICSLLNWLCSQDGLSYLKYGVAGTHYTINEQTGGAQSLLTDDAGNSAYFYQLNPQFDCLRTLLTANREGLALDGITDFAQHCQQNLEDGWWINNWRRAMFTDTLYTAQLSTFSLEGNAYGELEALIKESTDVPTDWTAYLAYCQDTCNAQGATDEVNSYADKNGIVTEE